MQIMTPAIRLSIGALFLLGGTAAFGLAGWVALNPYKSMSDEQFVAGQIKHCREAFTSFGYAVSTTPAGISVSSPGLSNWDQDLASLSMAIQQCQHFDLQSFCMGSTCKSSSLGSDGGSVIELRIGSSAAR